MKFINGTENDVQSKLFSKNLNFAYVVVESHGDLIMKEKKMFEHDINVFHKIKETLCMALMRQLTIISN